MIVFLEPSHLEAGGSVAGRLFMKDSQYREGTDYQVVTNPLVEITLKEQ